MSKIPSQDRRAPTDNLVRYMTVPLGLRRARTQKPVGWKRAAPAPMPDDASDPADDTPDPMPKAPAVTDYSTMRTMEGYFALFGQWTEICSMWEGNFMESIAPGAFTEPFTEDPDSIRCLFEHGADCMIGNKPLGVPTELKEDKIGAWFSVDLFDEHYVSQLKPALATEQFGSSFRFTVGAEMWTEPDKPTPENPFGLPERTIIEVEDLFEFGPCTFPAYEDTTAGLRSGTDHYLEQLRANPTMLAAFMERVGPNVAAKVLTGTADGQPQRYPMKTKAMQARHAADGPPALVRGRLTASARTEIYRLSQKG